MSMGSAKSLKTAWQAAGMQACMTWRHRPTLKSDEITQIRSNKDMYTPEMGRFGSVSAVFSADPLPSSSHRHQLAEIEAASSLRGCHRHQVARADAHLLRQVYLRFPSICVEFSYRLGQTSGQTGRFHEISRPKCQDLGSQSKRRVLEVPVSAASRASHEESPQ